MRIFTKWMSQNRGYMRQMLVCCSVSILYFIYGMLQTWPSLAIERIQEGAAGFSVTRNEIAVIVSMYNISAFLMPIVFGFILVKLGRKTNLLLNAVVLIVAWTLIAFASSPIWLMTGKFVAGLGIAIGLIIGPIYIAEIADKRIRGALICVQIAFIAFGKIFMTSVGIFIPYFELNLVALILSIISLTSIFVFAVESPCWHLMNNDSKNAENCFRYFWNANIVAYNSQVPTALAELKITVEAEMKSACSYRELFRNPGNTKALIIIISLSFFHSTSGKIPILTYASTTLPQYDGFWQPNPTMALVTTLNLVFNFVSKGLIDKLGRKPLSIVSNAGDALGTGIMAVFFFIDGYTAWDTVNIKWLPYIGILVYISFFGSAMAALPQVLVGELFPANVRYHASVVSLCCVAATSAFLNYIYLDLSYYAGVWLMYFIFTLCSIAATFFSCYFMFETKNMTLAEIQLKAMGKQRNAVVNTINALGSSS